MGSKKKAGVCQETYTSLRQTQLHNTENNHRPSIRYTVNQYSTIKEITLDGIHTAKKIAKYGTGIEVNLALWERLSAVLQMGLLESGEEA